MTETATQNQDQESKRCPNCDFDLSQRLPKPSEAEMQAFSRAVLSGTTYEKTFTLDNGMTLSFSEPTTKMCRIADQAMTRVAGHPRERTLHSKLSVLLRLSVFNGKPVGFPHDELLGADTPTKVEAVIEDNFERVLSNDLQVSLVLQVLEIYQVFVGTLTKLCLSQNFWKGVGLGA